MNGTANSTPISINSFGKYFVLTLVLFCFFELNAQESISDNVDDERHKTVRHSINFEALGRTFIMASLNYEFLLYDRFAIGAGAGFNSMARGEIIRNNNGVTETGRYFELYSSHMFYGTYFFGKRKHKMLLTAGITNFRRYDKKVYPSEKIVDRAKSLEWNAGIGYQFTGERMYFRATAYFLSLPHIYTNSPDYFPGIGFTVGHKLWK